MFAILSLIRNLLEEKNNSIDKANEKLKSIGYIFTNGTLKQIDKNATEAFWANKQNYRNLISGICEVYSSSELGEEMDNAAPPLMNSSHLENNSNNFNHDNSSMKKNNENGGNNGGLSYYSDINKDGNNINAKLIKSGSAIKKELQRISQVQDEINPYSIFSENSKAPEIIPVNNIGVNGVAVQNISNNKKKEDTINMVSQIIQNNNIRVSEAMVPNKNNKNEIDNNHKSQEYVL